MFAQVYQGKRVFVTGHTGFKGSWLCEWLISLGAKVAGYSIDIPSQPSHFEMLGLSARMKDIRGDVCDATALQAAVNDFKPDYVFHLAAQALVRDSYDRPALTFATNVLGTVNVLDAVRLQPSVKAAVFVATDKCYENREWEYGYRETDRLGGRDPYSASKACAELAFASYVKSFFNSEGAAKIASARAGNVIGGGDYAKDRIVPDCVRAWNIGKPVEIRHPHSTRPWQHVLEPLSGYLWLLAGLVTARAGIAGESFNFGPASGANQSVGTLIETLRETWPQAAWKTTAPDATRHEAKLLMLSCEKAAARLTWQPTMNFEEGTALTAEWYKNVASGSGDVATFTQRQIANYEAMARKRGASWTSASR